MSIENFKKEFIKYGVKNGHIKKPKRPKKDNSKRVIYFLIVDVAGYL